MAPSRVSTTRFEWLPDDPTAFAPSRLWKSPSITTWDDSRNQNPPIDSAEEGQRRSCPGIRPVRYASPGQNLDKELLMEICVTQSEEGYFASELEDILHVPVKEPL